MIVRVVGCCIRLRLAINVATPLARATGRSGQGRGISRQRRVGIAYTCAVADPAPQEFDAFVLTRHWRDTPDGLLLTFWLTSDAGPLRVRITGEQAVMFVEREVEAACDRRKRVDLATLAGTPVDALYFDSQARMLEQREHLRARDIQPLETDVKPTDRYLMERFITGPCRVHGRARAGSGYCDIADARLQAGDYTPRCKVMSMDIETEGMAGAILSIAAQCGASERVFIVGSGPEGPDLVYVPTEKALLSAFFAHVADLDPDLFIGWNLVAFDLSVIQSRCTHLGLRLGLGRGGERAVILPPPGPNRRHVARLPGRVALDGMGLMRAATYSFERFSLDHVARELLGRGKRIDQPENRLQEILRMYREDKLAFAAYNLEDCRLVTDIFAHARLIPFAIERQRMTGLMMDRAGGSVASFDFLYLPRMHRQGHVASDIGDFEASDENRASPGGYVLPSRPGLHDNVLVLDFKSLYPSIIRTFKIDPIGLSRPSDSEEQTDEDLIPGYDGAEFSRQRHILPDLIADLMDARARAKQAGDQPLSQAIKILMNSFYGVLGTTACRFFNPRLVSSITRRGHDIILRSRDFLDERGHDVIYGDTDSLFILLGSGHTPDECRRIGADLAEQVSDWWRTILAQEHRLDSHLEMEFETHYLRFFMPTLRGSQRGSAKRYAGLVVDANGDRDIVIKGLEAVRTDWTPLARDFQRELLRRAFLDRPVHGYITNVRLRLLAGQFDDQLVYRKRLRRPLDSYTKNVPPHVRAARLLDREVREVSYVWTTRGPQPIQQLHAPLDYEHYIKRQLAPAARGILHCLGTSFEAVTSVQLELFPTE